MPPLQQLIEQLGPPPPEVCVEWAWQIESVVEGRLDQPLDWSQLAATPDGDLKRLERMSSQAILHTTTRAQDLVDQLLRWSHGVDSAVDQTGNVIAPAGDRQTQLRTRTLQLSTQLNPSQPTAAQPGALQSNAVQNHVHKASTLRRSKGALKRTRVNASTPLQNQNSPSRSHQWSKPITTAVVVAVASCGAIAFFALNSGSIPSQPVASTIPDSQSPRKSNLTRPKALPSNELPSNGLHSSEQTDHSPTLQILESSVQENSEVQSLSTTSEAINNLNSNELASMIAAPKDVTVASSEGSEQNEEVAQSDNSVELEVGSESGSAENSIEPMQVNLLAEMDKIVQAADPRERESELLVEPGNPNAQPAMTLDLFPPNQIRKFAADGLPRLRSPVWHLRVEVAESLEVSPPSAQSIEGNGTAHWVISDSKAKKPATQIHVRAQLHNPRMATLRWNIAAGASDFPQFLVPLDSEMLDTMQMQLSRIIPQMQQSVEQLRGAGRTTGIASDIRSQIVKQRQELEVQIRAGKRLLEIVADANQLVGWLDGQLQVHTQLIDPSTEDSTPLLQFGNLSNAPDEAMDGEAKDEIQDDDLSAPTPSN